MPSATVAPFYKGWHLFNENLIEVLAPLTAEQLALPIMKPEWPVWASVSHLAGTRVYWLCQIFKEPGAETTPFNDPSGFGWEDDLSRPRSADELVHALESTWRIVERTLTTWTPEMLGVEFPRPVGGKVQLHTRQSVLIRMMTHDAFHSGEVSLVLGHHGLGAIEPWRGLSRIAE